MKKTTESDGFEGFADAKRRFFQGLAKHQDREWFAEHKKEFEDGWQKPMLALVTELRGAIDRAYPDCDLGEPKVFRIHRDVRFSADKSPYKTHVAGVIPARKGKPTEGPVALYLHLGADEAFAAGGCYLMPKEMLEAYRRSVVHEARGKELAAIVRALEKKGHALGAGDVLARVPRGFDAEHPRAELLKKKGLIASTKGFPEAKLVSRDLVPWLVGVAKDFAPLVRWLVFHA